jgi:hypothetical protein
MIPRPSSRGAKPQGVAPEASLSESALRRRSDGKYS